MGLASFGNISVNLDNILDTSKSIYQLNKEIINPECRNINQLIINYTLEKLYPKYSRNRF